jgi:hypothetical protein
VYGEKIAPGAVYEIQAIRACADPDDESAYSAPLTLHTSRFGDVVGNCETVTVPHAPPEGVVDSCDWSAIVDKFKNEPTAPRKARSDLTNSDVAELCVDRKVDFVDITTSIEAYKGASYPLCAMPGEPDCPDQLEDCSQPPGP